MNKLLTSLIELNEIRVVYWIDQLNKTLELYSNERMKENKYGMCELHERRKKIVEH